MEKLARYRTIITSIIEQEARYRPKNAEIEVCQICDTQHDQYQLLYLGWEQDRRVFAPIIHLRIHNNKIWIEQDGTEEGVANLLVKAGIPRDDIVLAFHSPRKRQFTDFAVA
ncbi:MAG TPA: XisI protein [Chloroflexota bacterium]|nr:XisI protein [Chloroflexota bacterium]